MSDNLQNTQPPREWHALHDAVYQLARAILEYLADFQRFAGRVNSDPLLSALDDCKRAADKVGHARHRAMISSTLYDAYEDATELAGRLVTPEARNACGEINHPNWYLSWRKADLVIQRLTGGGIYGEFRRALVSATQAPEPDRRIGSTVIIQGHSLSLSPQLAEMLELAIRPGGLPFDDARKHFSWDGFADSSIRARVTALKNALRRETKNAPFTIFVTTKGKRISATVCPKHETIEK